MRVCVPLYARTPLPPDAVARIEMNLALTAHWDATSARDFDVRADAERVQCPVLMHAGEDDPSTTIAGIEELVEALPAELVATCVRRPATASSATAPRRSGRPRVPSRGRAA
jgi:proline iminopeptidase